jgi:hypothetical protein
MKLLIPTEVYEGEFAKSVNHLASIMNEATREGKRAQVVPMGDRAWVLISHTEKVAREVPNDQLPPQFLAGQIPSEFKVDGEVYPESPASEPQGNEGLSRLASDYAADL